ncbi:SWIM zinc finger family protein [Acidianus brierleyi]|uniref:SWIM-type domain-containing protein n=1 Tax=Acidianus brierleyi TaxID=41673 RepID=A0A2U9IGS9_9CREN|nr:SWIM zinc finger family protein [Acidianus brierleyi]AWR95257.1 hypothetical protein DFR85_12270 [Acidianus brierleyi]
MRKWWAWEFGESIRKNTDHARAQRGREYAQNGAVKKIEINPGKISAEVLGTTMYKVTIYGSTIPIDEKEKIINIIHQKGYLSSIISSEIPKELKKDLEKENIHLIPQKLGFNCTCPDYKRPCKHIYAVQKVLNDMMSYDPFILFKFLGIEKEHIILGNQENELLKEYHQPKISVKDFQKKYTFSYREFSSVEPWNQFKENSETIRKIYHVIMNNAEKKLIDI